MKIFCVRHGHAQTTPDTQGERPLTEQGQLEVGKVANYLAFRGFHVSHVMQSNILRAKQTAQILADKLAVDITPEETPLLQPEASVISLCDELKEWDDDTMLVGHMPFLSLLVSQLVVGSENYNLVRFTPGTVVCLERYENQRWIINWIVRPDLVDDKFSL